MSVEKLRADLVQEKVNAQKKREETRKAAKLVIKENEIEKAARIEREATQKIQEEEDIKKSAADAEKMRIRRVREK